MHVKSRQGRTLIKVSLWVVTPIYTFIKDFAVPDAFPWGYMDL